MQQAKTFLGDSELSVWEQATVQGLQARLLKTLGLFRAGGLFACFAGPADRITPALLTEEATPVIEVGEEEAKQAENKSNEMSAEAGA